MIWAILGLLILLAVFMRRMMLPMFFGLVIGAGVFLAAPVFKFEAAPELIMFCGAAGFILGLGRILLFGNGDGGKGD